MEEQKVQITRTEYWKLFIAQVKEIQRSARENHKQLSLRDSASQARQIVNDFYICEETPDRVSL